MRIKKYFQENKFYVDERRRETEVILQAELLRQAEALRKDFVGSFDRLFHCAAAAQQRGEKGAIAWVCVSYLRSSLLTKTNDLRIDAYDSDFYLDVRETAAYWSGDFVYRQLEPDIAYFIKAAREHLIRVSTGEIKFFMTDYFCHYADFLQSYCRRHLPEAMALESYRRMEKTAAIKFTFGEYLEKTKVIYPNATEKEGSDDEGASH